MVSNFFFPAFIVVRMQDSLSWVCFCTFFVIRLWELEQVPIAPFFADNICSRGEYFFLIIFASRGKYFYFLVVLVNGRSEGEGASLITK